MVCRIFCNIPELTKKIELLKSEIPDLISKGMWENVENIIFVSSDIFECSIAHDYNQMARKAIDQKDVETLNNLSKILEEGLEKLILWDSRLSEKFLEKSGSVVNAINSESYVKF